MNSFILKLLKISLWVCSSSFTLISSPLGYTESYNNDQTLPTLGDSTSSLYSLDYEYQLGRAWLMSFRNQVDIVADPLLQDYLEHTIYQLATFSELKDHRLEIVIINNPTINAFAAPGGVIGVNNGLLTYAKTEAQLATVLAHEIAHLSQRHFARGIEQQKRNAIPNAAATLASIFILATQGGEAGMTALAATQAANLQNQLRYSRENEQEADRIGMQTMIKADIDPYAAAAMFENMLQAARYAGKRPPEFLLTHPVTEKRIADSRNRAMQQPRKVYTDNLYYQLMRTRVELSFINTGREAVKRFRAKTESSTQFSEADQYGLVLALTRNGDYAQARELLTPLLNDQPNQIPYLIAASDIDFAQNSIKQGLARLNQALELAPNNYPLTMTLSKHLLQVNQSHRAEALLEGFVKTRPKSPDVWYQLAEARGLAGNIVGVHQARAEYFILKGRLDVATQQLGYALPLVKDDGLTTLRIQERIQQINQLKLNIKAL